MTQITELQLQKINAVRRRSGKRQLAMDDAIRIVAQRRSADIEAATEILEAIVDGISHMRDITPEPDHCHTSSDHSSSSSSSCDSGSSSDGGGSSGGGD